MMIVSIYKKIYRSVLWLFLLSHSLLRYWINNPQSTGRVILFLLKKVKYLPMFLKRNTESERVGNEYAQLLKTTVELYNKSVFDPRSSASYAQLKRKLINPYQILYFLVRKLRPLRVVETGVAGGVSSGFILQAMKDNNLGKLYSIDLPFQWYSYGQSELHLDSLPPGKLSGYLVPEELKKNWKLVIGETHAALPKLLNRIGAIDLFFHDSEHTYETMMFEYQLSWSKLSKKGVLVSDDVGFSDAFHFFVKQKNRKGFIFHQVGITFRYNNR